jgi:predicted phage terminase large subunit-like protein
MLALAENRHERRAYLAMLDEKARRQAVAQRKAEQEAIAKDAAQIRERCKTLAGFVREAWHVLEPTNPYVYGWHIDAICQHLEAVTDGRITRLLINIPPGCMKSLLVGVFWPAWEWGPYGDPSKRIIGASYSEDYAKRDNGRMRDLITSDWYQALWPIELVKSGELLFTNASTGWRQAVPISRLTGGRGDRVIIDDPHSTEGAESEAERGRAIRIFRESVPTRMINPEKSAIIVVMQRLHERDVSGVAIEMSLGYEHLMLPMEFDPSRACRTSIGFRDPRTYAGELLFPERFPRAVVDRDKVPLGAYGVSGQFQQQPTPRSGGLFQRSDFEIVDAMPARIKRKVRAWDFGASAPSPGTDPDYTVGGLGAVDFDGAFYICEIERGQWSSGKVETVLKNTASRDGTAIAIIMPQDPGAAGKSDAQTKIKLLAGYNAKAKVVSGDKATRARPASAQAEAGNIKLVRGSWNEAFLEEVCTFPNAAHDDQVDVLSDLINELALGGSSYNLAALAD